MTIPLRSACAAALVCLSAGALASAQEAPWTPMFDGKSLEGWKETPFTSRGKVEVKDGMIVLGSGYLTGINWAGKFPETDYEIRFEAMRISGHDFFASITFPVKKSFCTWISGGWGGSLVGLSSLDGNDASENETSTSHEFVTGRWYSFRLQVTANAIRAWIDGAQFVEADITGRRVDLRPGDIELSVPVGFAAYSSVGGIRKIEYRLLAK